MLTTGPSAGAWPWPATRCGHTGEAGCPVGESPSGSPPRHSAGGGQALFIRFGGLGPALFFRRRRYKEAVEQEPRQVDGRVRPLVGRLVELLVAQPLPESHASLVLLPALEVQEARGAE